MPLPSQSPRSSSHKSSVFRAKPHNGSKRSAFLLAPVIMLAVWVLMPASGEPGASEVSAQEPAATQPASAPVSEAALVSESVPPSQAAPSAGWLDAVQLPDQTGASRQKAASREAPSLGSEPAPAVSTALPGAVGRGMHQLEAGEVLAGRTTLSQALLQGGLSSAAAATVRAELAPLGERWILGPELLPNDPFTSVYRIAQGDLLSRLPGRLGLDLDWRLLQRINAIKDPARIRLGQKIKLIHGAFHAVVHKSEYRMDLFLGDPAGDAGQIYVRSFQVGHGEKNCTPVGSYRVRKGSKLINPAWTNPRTKKRVAADDPENPIGEHWIGLEGVSEAVRDVQALGIHGTTDLDSIGKMRSMGCVRMFAEDVALVYEVLVRPASSIEIRP